MEADAGAEAKRSRWRWLKAALAVVFGLVFVLAALVASAPWWIDLAMVRTRLEAMASKAVGGSVSSAKIRLVWRPTPEASLEGVSVVSPAAVASVTRVRVAFAFGPLLHGSFEPSSVSLEGADVFLRRKDGRGIWIEGLGARASLDFRDGATRVVVSRLAAASPALTLEGVFSSSSSSSPSSASLTARGSLDVAGLRSPLLEFAGDDRTIAQIFSIVRSGRLASFTFASEAEDPGGLFALERMKIRGAVEGARVVIEAQGLDLRDVSADVSLEGGVLAAEKASARLGRSRAEDARVLVGLSGGDGRLRIEARVKADLPEVPGVLARAVPSLRAFLAPIAIRDGEAKGSLVIGDCAGALEPEVRVDEMSFRGVHAGVPWPLAVEGGAFGLRGSRISLKEIGGSLGLSRFAGVNASLLLSRGVRFERATGQIEVALEDFFEGVKRKTLPGAGGVAAKVRRLEGTARIDLRRLEGPLDQPAALVVEAGGSLERITFEGSSLPPLTIDSARFEANDRSLGVSEADVHVLDADVRISLTWVGWRGEAASYAFEGDGTAGAEAIRYAWSRASLPPPLLPAAPVAFRGLKLSVASGGGLGLSGSFGGGAVPVARLDLSTEGGTAVLRDLTIEDGGRTASLSLRRASADAVDVTFHGRLDLARAGALLASPPAVAGVLDGDLSARVVPSKPGRSTADGALRAESVGFRVGGTDVLVERFDARLSGSRVTFPASSFRLGERAIAAEGAVTLGEGALSVDLASLDAFGFAFRPAAATVRFGTEGTAVSVSRAETCGISLSGEAKLRKDGTISLDARADGSGPDVGTVLTCFGVEGVPPTGSWEASASVSGEAPAADLLKAVRGPVSFKSAKGRLGKAGILAKLLTVLNATEVFKGKDRTKVGGAMPYDSIVVEGEIANGTVAIREASLVGPAVTIAAEGTVAVREKALDLAVLAHPFSTADKVISKVPVVGHVLGKDFLAVGAKVTGPLDDPKVSVTPGQDVGKGLVGILERTVTLPVTVFDPSKKSGERKE